MNDFTKQELSIILFWGLDRVQAVDIENFTEEGHLKLFHKLHDMIVNYCEHDWDNSCCVCPMGCIYCTKCFKCLDDDKSE